MLRTWSSRLCPIWETIRQFCDYLYDARHDSDCMHECIDNWRLKGYTHCKYDHKKWTMGIQSHVKFLLIKKLRGKWTERKIEAKPWVTTPCRCDSYNVVDWKYNGTYFINDFKCKMRLRLANHVVWAIDGIVAACWVFACCGLMP